MYAPLNSSAASYDIYNDGYGIFRSMTSYRLLVLISATNLAIQHLTTFIKQN